MWNNIFKTAPSNGQVVWVRAPFFFGNPIVATYDSTSQLFTSNLDGVTFPAYIVGRWKVYTAPATRPIGVAQVGIDLVIG